jgi:hypothetical protein
MQHGNVNIKYVSLNVKGGRKNIGTFVQFEILTAL